MKTRQMALRTWCRGVAVIAMALAWAGCEAASGGTNDATTGIDAATDIPAEAAPAGKTVRVVHGDQTKTADLSLEPVVTVKDLPFVRLSDVVGQVFPSLDLSTVTADFTAGDGFQPASSPNCATLIPVDGSLLSRGYISPETRNLAWDDDLQYPGCMRVRDTAEIRLVDRE